MHSLSVRAQNVFGFFTSVVFCTAFFVAVSVLLYPQEPSAAIAPVLHNTQVVKGRANYYSAKKEEYASIKFDLEADLTSLFNWNTKQVFVWLTATYPALPQNSSQKLDTLPRPLSQAIIWDVIIPSTSQLNPIDPISYIRSVIDKQSYKSLTTKASAKSKLKSKSSPKKLQKKSTKPGTDKTKDKNKKPDIKTASAAPGLIRLKNQRPKYQITDVAGLLSARENVTLELGWNVQPWVGALTWTMADGTSLGRWKGIRGGQSRSFTLPTLKGVKPVVAAAA